jgi:hypothetical protein
MMMTLCIWIIDFGSHRGLQDILQLAARATLPVSNVSRDHRVPSASTNTDYDLLLGGVTKTSQRSKIARFSIPPTLSELFHCVRRSFLLSPGPLIQVGASL